MSRYELFIAYERVGALYEIVGLLRGDNDDRNLLDPVIAVHGFQHGKTAHIRHDHVEHHQVDVGRVTQKEDRVGAVDGLLVLISVAEDLLLAGRG